MPIPLYGRMLGHDEVAYRCTHIDLAIGTGPLPYNMVTLEVRKWIYDRWVIALS
jgi:hypothetical protein